MVLGGVSVAVEPAAFCSVSGVAVITFLIASSLLSRFFGSRSSSAFFCFLFLSVDLSDFLEDYFSDFYEDLDLVYLTGGVSFSAAFFCLLFYYYFFLSLFVSELDLDSLVASDSEL